MLNFGVYNLNKEYFGNVISLEDFGAGLLAEVKRNDKTFYLPIGKAFLQKIDYKDKQIILDSIRKTNCIVSCEEHNIIGGLGESVSRLIVKNILCPMEFVGVNDTFGESGKPEDLMKKYKLDSENIIEKCKKVISRKK